MDRYIACTARTLSVQGLKLSVIKKQVVWLILANRSTSSSLQKCSNVNSPTQKQMAFST